MRKTSVFLLAVAALITIVVPASAAQIGKCYMATDLQNDDIVSSYPNIGSVTYGGTLDCLAAGGPTGSINANAKIYSIANYPPVDTSATSFASRTPDPCSGCTGITGHGRAANAAANHPGPWVVRFEFWDELDSVVWVDTNTPNGCEYYDPYDASDPNNNQYLGVHCIMSRVYEYPLEQPLVDFNWPLTETEVASTLLWKVPDISPDDCVQEGPGCVAIAG